MEVGLDFLANYLGGITFISRSVNTVFHIFVFLAESPGAYLLSRWGKLNRWKMFDSMSRMNSVPSKMEKVELRKVIKASIDIFEQV